MALSVKYYTLNEYIRLNKAGELDIEESMKLIRTLVSAAAFKPQSHILIDLRETRLKDINIGDVFKIAREFSKCQTLIDQKIASMVPDEQARLQIAEQFKSAMNLSGFEYEFFTDMEQAIEWLSDVDEVKLS